MKPYLASDLKDLNRKTVYRLISSVGEISKAEISRRTGISSPTVIKIVNFFIDKGFLVPIGEGHAALGRKPQMLKFNSEAAFSIGIEYEGDFLKIGVVDLLGNIKYFKKYVVKPDFKYVINEKLSVYINEIISESGIERNKILGVGLGVPCVVDNENHTIDVAPLVGLIKKTNYSSMIKGLSDKINLPVIIENDVNSAAIGEYVFRKLGSTQNMVFISLGTGLGAGIILKGSLWRGVHSFAGEIGYMVFDKEYQVHKSKAGWLESRISIKTLLKDLNLTSGSYVSGKKTGTKNIADQHVIDAVKKVVEELALVVANISIFLDINRIIIGGMAAEIMGQHLSEALNHHLKRLSILNIKCEIQRCSEPGVVGMASLITEKVLNELLIDEV